MYAYDPSTLALSTVKTGGLLCDPLIMVVVRNTRSSSWFTNNYIMVNGWPLMMLNDQVMMSSGSWPMLLMTNVVNDQCC